MQTEILYNQYVRTINPIDVTLSFLSVIPKNEIQVVQLTDTKGNLSTNYGRYDEEGWGKFYKDIELNGIKEFLTLSLEKNEFGINEFKIKDGSHRLYALSKMKKDCKIPVMIDIDANIPFDELRDLFNMLTQAKIISNRDYAALLNQFVLLQIKEIKHGFWDLISENKSVSSKYKGSSILSFIDLIETNKIKSYIKTEGIDFSWSFKNGKLVYKFEDGNEVYDVSKKYSLYSMDSDGDVIKAATKVTYQIFEGMSPTTMRALGIFDGWWINCTILYGEIDGILQYNSLENYLRLNHIVNENGDYRKDGVVILKELSNLIGTITTTSEVLQYEGDNLNSIKSYVKNKTSTWKVLTENEISEQKIKASINDLIASWKKSNEFKKIQSGSFSQFDIDKLLDMMNSDLSDKLNIKDNEQIEFVDLDGFPLKLSNSSRKKEMDLINVSKRLFSDLNKYISKDILGLTSDKVGLDFSTRFNSNPKEYLQTKSIKFSKKQSNPDEFLNTTIIIEKINILIEELQRLEYQSNSLIGIQRDKTEKFIKGIAYNTLRLKSNLYNVRTFTDLMKALANHQYIFSENVSPIKLKLSNI